MTDRTKPRRRSAPAASPTRAALAGAEDRLLKLDEVKQLAGIGKTMVYRLMRAGSFPQACKPLGSSSSRWSEREVTAWVDAQLAARAA